MLILIFSILLFILSIIFIYIGYDNWSEWLFCIGLILIISMSVCLIVEVGIIISKPIDYRNFKIEYDVVKGTITSSEDIRDTNYTQKLIEINTKIKTNREYKDSIWCGIFFNKKIAVLELLQK